LLPIPEPLNPDLVVVPGIDSQDTPKKMAIENGNDIPLFAEEDVIQERIDAIVTRPIQWGDPLPTEGCNILTYAACIAGAKAKDEFRENYGSGHYGYKNAKQDLRDLFFRTFSDARRRYSELSDGKVQEVLAFGATKARDQLTEVLFDLRETVAGS